MTSGADGESVSTYKNLVNFSIKTETSPGVPGGVFMRL